MRMMRMMNSIVPGEKRNGVERFGHPAKHSLTKQVQK
jgi:hypothetical protein